MMGSALCVSLADARHAIRRVGTSLDAASWLHLQATGLLARPQDLPVCRRELPLLSHLIDLGLQGAPRAMPFEEFFRT
jgi:hypothetical protein